MNNQDAIDLHNRVPNGTRVKVRTEAESLAIEGPQMLNAYGHMIPASPENQAKKAKEEAALAKEEARDKAAAESRDYARIIATNRLIDTLAIDRTKLVDTSTIA